MIDAHYSKFKRTGSTVAGDVEGPMQNKNYIGLCPC